MNQREKQITERLENLNTESDPLTSEEIDEKEKDEIGRNSEVGRENVQRKKSQDKRAKQQKGNVMNNKRPQHKGG